jgi:predicted signal transduction protein with EAL and GGDEF domain
MARNARRHEDFDSRLTASEEKFRAELDQLLTAARQEYARSGEPWLDWDGLEREIAERRGGVSGDED